jgi:Uma2 family endonuclease
MSATVALMTSDELFALPDADKFDRWLIDGELREEPMSLRSPSHAAAVLTLSCLLGNWCVTRPQPRPRGYAGDIYFRLRSDPDTNVGIDVALATPTQAAGVTPDTRFIDRPPALAVEVLSASDTIERIQEKLDSYLTAGTPQVWVVDPFDSTVTVYRPGRPPVLYNDTQELPRDPELPGFRCRVAEIFE